jgi:sugar (pentulose or hexulose) kinase
MRPGDLLHDAGAGQVLAAVIEHPTADPRRRVLQLGVGGAFIHLTHNPVGVAALDWMHAVCFCDQAKEVFYGPTLSEALERKTRVTLDPPNLAGDWLEVDAHRAAFRDLTLETDRLDLLAAVVQEMRRQYQRALAALGRPEGFERIFLAGAETERVRQLLPEYATAIIQPLEEGSLRGVARLFG